jgi:hypothetical protein
VDWDEVYKHLQDLDDLIRFAEIVRSWLHQETQEEIKPSVATTRPFTNYRLPYTIHRLP